ncbi:HD domain-containing phosphohydrolase [Marispirochaeta sp.]|uniref:GAF and HD-GYP domain-containing protein n=1 Tax=Marispirochaeta sp. TaxID=2038653 RepID=UPI0029C64D34|nr:HD domain-containing phosphohydrolase [Marispirochaeta sp.]
MKIIERLHSVKDVDILLENILHEARTFVNADAGTLYQLKDNQLYFAFIENETLFNRGESENDKYLYTTRSIPADTKSIAGFVAETGQSLLIDDVYSLPEEVSFQFNSEFDRKSNYRTRSILAVPLKNSEGSILGVIQLINAIDKEGNPVPFSQQDRLFISYFAQHAAMALEKAEFAKEMVLRLVEISQLRDPHESRLHAQRVGEYSAAVFDAFGSRIGTPPAQRNRGKEALRLAALLHDIGKVGLDSRLLSKGDEFSSDDKETMIWHTIFGARLFYKRSSVWDRVAFEVALSHHERWDGYGYPGHIENIFSDTLKPGPGKVGKEIPLSGRIVAIADVFDALVTPRTYKDPWDEDSAFLYIKSKAGKQFDPELVDVFLSIKDTIVSILKNTR